LLLLLAVVGMALSIRFEVARDSTPERLAGLDPAALSLVALDRSGEPKLSLERTPEGWRLREPFDVDAEQAQVDRLLDVLAAPVYRTFPESSASRAELGLEPPRIKLKLDNLLLGFGGLDPVGQHRYVGADGLIHLIDDRYYPTLIAPPVDFVSRVLAQRGTPPVFGTLKGVPIAASAIKIMGALRAVRIEQLSGEPSGDPLELKSVDGSATRFLVSEDRRKLARADLKILYVLADPLMLELDPTAVDPTPPAPPPRPAKSVLPPAEEGLPASAPAARPEPASESTEPFTPSADPDAPVPGDAPLGAPPAVRIGPNRPAPTAPVTGAHRSSGGGFGAEPYKAPPQGFGQDPFAPDPTLDPNALGTQPAEPPAPGSR
jgi:hypothetical protein